MMVRFLLMLIAFHLSLASHALPISADILNSELKKNYSFVERSLNQSDLKIETSSGKILFDPLGVTVKVLEPFEENYRIEEDRIEIHDVFLDQKQIIDIDQLDNFFINILMCFYAFSYIQDQSKGKHHSLINWRPVGIVRQT